MNLMIEPCRFWITTASLQELRDKDCRFMDKLFTILSKTCACGHAANTTYSVMFENNSSSDYCFQECNAEKKFLQNSLIIIQAAKLISLSLEVRKVGLHFNDFHDIKISWKSLHFPFIVIQIFYYRKPFHVH